MCRISIALVALVGGVFLPAAEAQVMLGAKAGYNLTMLSFEKSDGYSGKNISEDGTGGGFHCGMFLRSKSKGPVALRIEALYSQRTSSLNYGISGSVYSPTYEYNGTVMASFSYIEMPVMVAISPGGGLDFQFGLSPSILVSADVTDEWTKSVSSGYTDVGSDFDKVVVELVPGVSYDFANGIHLSARYVVGLEEFDITRSSSIRQAVFQFSAGYCFLGKRTS